MKILSTPTASTRNGITSKMMRVAFTLRYEKNPMLAETESITIVTPAIPSENFMSTMKDSKQVAKRKKARNFNNIIILSALNIFFHGYMKISLTRLVSYRCCGGVLDSSEGPFELLLTLLDGLENILKFPSVRVM